MSAKVLCAQGLVSGKLFWKVGPLEGRVDYPSVLRGVPQDHGISVSCLQSYNENCYVRIETRLKTRLMCKSLETLIETQIFPRVSGTPVL